MLKNLSTILLLVITFLQTFSLFVIRTDYYLNKSVITEKLCVNKAKPKMHCNGKCYLAKQLKEKEQQNKQAPDGKKGSLEINIYMAFALPVSTFFVQKLKTEYNTVEDLKVFSFPHYVFHPPAA